jgi:hypothetical protein
VFIKSLATGLIAGMAMALSAVAAETPAPASGNGATFVNSGNHSVTLYTRFGSDGSCESQPKDQTVTLEAKQTITVDSGGSSVCFCLQVPERATCGSGWIVVKAGGTRHLM